MMKHVLGVVALAGMSCIASAQTLSFVKAIDVGGIALAPTGIVFYNGDLYVNGFSTRNVAKVAAPLSATPVVSQLASLAATPWESGRGPQGLAVNPANGNLYSVGDGGGTIGGYIAVIDQAGAILQNLAYGAGNRTVSGALFGPDPDLVVSRSTSSGLADVADPAAGVVTTEGTFTAATAPINAAHRDLAVVGNTVYYTRNGGTGVADAVAKYTGGTAGDTTGYAASLVFSSTSVGGTAALLGLGVYTTPSKTFVVFADLATAGNAALRFINTATDTVDINYTDVNLAVGGLRDVAFGTIGGIDYAFVTRSGGTPNQAVLVYEITPAANVHDWSIY